MSQRALQAHADPMLGWTDLDGVGFVVSEVSPYEDDLDWSELTEPDEIGPVVEYLGRATAKVHCVADSDADHSLVPLPDRGGDRPRRRRARGRVRRVGGRRSRTTYAAQVRADHALFVDAFREGRIPGVAASG